MGIEINIRGKVFPLAWDENHNVTEVVVDTPNQDGYIIDPRGKGKALLDFIRREVEVTGILKEDQNGDFILNVKEYRVVNGEEEKLAV
jgi:hypothetical protein